MSNQELVSVRVADALTSSVKKRKTKDDETAHELWSCALIELIIYANNLKWPCGTKKKKKVITVLM